MKISAFLVLLVLADQAFGVTRFTCSGKHRGVPIELKGQVPALSLTSLHRASGTVLVDNREVASFREGELSVSLMFRTFKAKNNHGDILEGKVTDLIKHQAVLKKLIVPGYGIRFANVYIHCQ